MNATSAKRAAPKKIAEAVQKYDCGEFDAAGLRFENLARGNVKNSVFVGRVISNPFRIVLPPSGASVTIAELANAALAAAISSGVAMRPVPVIASANCL